jgi:hypothetical protein
MHYIRLHLRTICSSLFENNPQPANAKQKTLIAKFILLSNIKTLVLNCNRAGAVIDASRGLYREQSQLV